jgi:cell division septum initiation protein DivIVA
MFAKPRPIDNEAKRLAEERGYEARRIAAEKRDAEKYEIELKRVDKRLAELDSQFLNQLDGLLKRKVLIEEEFQKLTT